MAKARFLVPLMVFVFFCEMEVGAAFENIGLTARAMGMGGAYSAVARDTSALIWNPAGAAQISSPEIGLSSVELYGLLSYSFVGWAHPIRLGQTVGAALLTVAEIYQGARQSYEHKNAPRGIRDGEEADAAGGFQQPGMLWNAWGKGYKIGVIASSDHYSTHVSYAMVYTPDTGRESIHDSIRKRRAYGATDNIVLDFRMGGAFMGEEIAAAGPQRIRLRARGTDKIAAVHLIRDAAYIYKVEPNKVETEFEYLDAEAGPGEHWYYARVEQADGELAWSSPIWISQGE